MASVPKPGKVDATTACVFTEHVFWWFGSCAEVIANVGTDATGEFAIVEAAIIDHHITSPNYPQADGFVERSGQTIKCSLKRHCAPSGTLYNRKHAVRFKR
eukprot:1144534-Pelagomonas_calceolata.AAC.1